MAAPNATSFDEFQTIEGLAEKYPHILSAHSIRWILRDRDKNGFAAAVIKSGHRLLIHEPTFLAKFIERGQAS